MNESKFWFWVLLDALIAALIIAIMGVGLPVMVQWVQYDTRISVKDQKSGIAFDLAEAESELVAGFHTEFSGMKWSLFFLMEYGYVLLASFLLAVFFLGGGAAPLPHPAFIPAWLSIPSWIWMTSKAMLMMFVFLWFRWTFPRLRVDQLMDFNWKFLLPWSFANIGLAGVLIYLHLQGWGLR